MDVISGGKAGGVTSIAHVQGLLEPGNGCVCDIEFVQTLPSEYTNSHVSTINNHQSIMIQIVAHLLPRFNQLDFFFPRTFFLAQGLVGAVLLGSFQACAIYIPAAPDVQGNRAKSKPLLLRGGLGRGWRLGGGWPQPAPHW